MNGKNVCAMSKACEGKDADHGLMCADCRAEDMAIHAGCLCPLCANQTTPMGSEKESK